MKKIPVLPLLLCLIFCSFISLDKNLYEFNPDRIAYGSYGHMAVSGSYASSDKAVLYSNSDMSALMNCQYIEEIPSFPAIICRMRTSSLGFLGRLTSNLSWLGALLQLIHIILFAYAAIVVMRICLTNTSRRFIIRFIHDKDGHKLISFAHFSKFAHMRRELNYNFN